MTTVVNRNTHQFDIDIGRPGPYGNPFSHRLSRDRRIIYVATREEAIRRYSEWVYAQPELVAQIRSELKGKRLGCWCKPEPCHGDVLVKIAEGL